MKEKIIGFALISLSLMAVLGFLMNNFRYWVVFDFAVVIICATAGISILAGGKNH